MKKKMALLLITIMFVLSGCMSIFTALAIEEPVNSESSMLVVEIGSDGEYLMNNNYTGWAPLIEDVNGNVIVMQMINGIADAKTIYVAPNIAPGVYKMVGIRHVYTDYGLVNSSDSPIYEPYVKTSYQIQQDFPLNVSVNITVPSKEMVSLGYYDVSYDWNGGGFASKDDRWKVIPSSVKITSDPTSKSLLKAIKGSLNSTTWKLWNERNPL